MAADYWAQTGMSVLLVTDKNVCAPGHRRECLLPMYLEECV